MIETARYSPRARNDINDVWKGVWYASGDFDVADQYVDELLDLIEGKKLFPLSGIPLYYRNLFTGFYSINYKAYKVFYRVDDEYIEVIRILPAKTDYLKILFGG